jgi:hypothetical protein
VFAYHVPLNPYEPRADEWATLVRPDRVCVGDRLDDLAWTEASGQLVTTRGSPDEWEVIAVEPTGDEGRRAVVHRKLSPETVWDGTLVLRLVRQEKRSVRKSRPTLRRMLRRIC